MRIHTSVFRPSGLLPVLVTACLLAPLMNAAAARKPRGRGEEMTEEAKKEYKAYDMLKRASELLRVGQEERAVKMLSSIPRMFPDSKVRFEAYLTLGKHYVDTRQFDLAVKQFRMVADDEESEQQAEALYQIGICYYNMNNFDRAFVALRQVTNEFPGSVFANESYYYIGQCHFRLGRWAKAVEALKMVGTSVPPNTEGDMKAEAGQRLFVKISDKDLVVLLNTGRELKVEFSSARGDKEVVAMEPLGKTGDYYIGSVETELGEPKPGDGKLQVIGREKATVRYVDENTESGKRLQPIIATVEMVSTAAAGFTDGAFREYVDGVFGDSDCFLRVKDLDRDATAQTDTVQVKVWTRYKLEKEEDDGLGGVDLSGFDEAKEEVFELRDYVNVTLTETSPHSGLFVGKILPAVAVQEAQVDQSDQILSALKGDEIVLDYWDEIHMAGEEPRAISSSAKLLIGEIQDVKIIHRVVDSLDLKARKNLIEAKIFLRLGQIFKDVGLIQKAEEKADQGLERVEDVISTSLKASLDRQLVEEAFSVKWELLLVQDKLNAAIQVCRSLTQLFPDSTLVDQALLKIGQAKMEGEDPQEAVSIFSGILRLQKSDLKAEAQFSIARVYELIAERHARDGRPPDLSRALLSYSKCAETYPESPFAGEALEKIANFYITSRDFARAVELMERVFQDYPDARFLDSMLLKWVIAAYRMGNYQLAKDKASQLLAEYPNSKYAGKAQKFLGVIEKKL